jgi:hypothetical protein
MFWFRGTNVTTVATKLKHVKNLRWLFRIQGAETVVMVVHLRGKPILSYSNLKFFLKNSRT